MSSSLWTVVVTFSKVALGSGALTVPFALANAGLASGGAVLVVVALLQWLSLEVIWFAMSRRKNRLVKVRSHDALEAAPDDEDEDDEDGGGSSSGRVVLQGDSYAGIARDLYGPAG